MFVSELFRCVILTFFLKNFISLCICLSIYIFIYLLFLPNNTIAHHLLHYKFLNFALIFLSKKLLLFEPYGPIFKSDFL